MAFGFLKQITISVNLFLLLLRQGKQRNDDCQSKANETDAF